MTCEYHAFLSREVVLFWVNNVFKMINLFTTFAPEDSKQLLSCLYVAILQFCAEKSPKDAEVGELCGSAPPHPVRCPVIKLGLLLLVIFTFNIRV